MKMVSPASGGLLTINGRAGGRLQELSQADQGKPGKEIVPDRKNISGAITGLGGDAISGLPPASGCNPQTNLQRSANNLRQKVLQKLLERIQQKLEQQVEQNVNLKNLEQQQAQIEQQIQELVQQQLQIERLGEGAIKLQVLQQILQQQQQLQQVLEIVQTQNLQQQQQILTQVLKEVAEELPEVSKVAGEAGKNIAEKALTHLRTKIPQAVVKTDVSKSYLQQQTIQKVQQACFLG